MTPLPWWVIYVVTALLSVVWAASEVIATFETTPVRALLTRGAVVLMLINAFFACLALLAVVQIAPDADENLLTAFVVGFGWQALVRSQVNVFRPLPGQPGGEGLTVPVDEVYGRIQRFVRRSIDQSLARDRTQLLEEALALDIETLKHQVELMSYGLSEMDPEEVQRWLREMDSRQMTDEQRKMLLASKLIEASGPKGLRQFVTNQKQRSQPAVTPAAATPATVTPDGVGLETVEAETSEDAETT